jgi:acyl carrier protein
VRAFLLDFLARELRLTPEQIRLHRELRDYGADSITVMHLIRAVDQEWHVKISARDFLEHRTVHALWTYLLMKIEASQPAVPDALDQFQQGLLTLEDMEALLDQGKIV